MTSRKRGNRTIRKEIYLTQDEWDIIQERMGQIGTSNFNDYGRKMAMNGQIIKRDFSSLRPLLDKLSIIEQEIHQVLNQNKDNHEITQEDMDTILKELHTIQGLINLKIGQLLR